ncbi:Major facilitator superfamily domain-containing protein 10 [Aphelenchoides avenae]|nr:Major facilitator superfamily domain-containing protein 10 [Aphelenchus avenae]
MDLIAFTCILPLFPSILDQYSGTEDGLYLTFQRFAKWLQNLVGVPDVEKYNSVFLGGLLGSLFSFLQYLSSPIMGALSDVCGRKPLLILSIAGSLASYYLWSISESFTMFVLSRIVGGLSKASISVAVAIVTDLCPMEKRGRGMAYVGVAFSIGFLIGPMIGAYFSANAKLSNELFPFNAAPAKFAIYLTMAELLTALALLPETLTRPGLTVNDVVKAAYDYISPRSLFAFKVLEAREKDEVRAYGRIYFVYLLFYSALEFTLTFLTHIRFQYDSMQQGRMYLFVGILMIAVQGGYVRRIAVDRQRKAVLCGLTAIIPSYLIISVASQQITLYLGLMLYALASAIVVPCLTTLVSSQCSEAEKGSCMGVFRSIGALSRACGPILGSLLFWLAGPSACYAVGEYLTVMISKIQPLFCVAYFAFVVFSAPATITPDDVKHECHACDESNSTTPHCRTIRQDCVVCNWPGKNSSIAGVSQQFKCLPGGYITQWNCPVHTTCHETDECDVSCQ